jgi:hypothetical protein
MVTYYLKCLCTTHPNNTSFLCCLYRALWYNYTTQFNGTHTLKINALFRFLSSSTCFKTHGFIIRQTVCSRRLCILCFSYIYASSLAGGAVCLHTLLHLPDCLRITTIFVDINNVYSWILNYKCYDYHFIYVYWFWYFGILTFYVFVLCVLPAWVWP